MSDCPACAGYAEHAQRAIDAAGRQHVVELTRIRAAESRGVRFEPIVDTVRLIEVTEADSLR